LGLWSYGFYLLHCIVLVVTNRLRPETHTLSWSNVAIGALDLTIAVALSWAAYQLVERPAERWLRRHP